MTFEMLKRACFHAIYEPGVDPALKPCPFCGERLDLRVCNTHTPAYWVECPCGAERHGPPVGGERQHRSRSAHAKAMRNAIGAWNRRASPSTKEGADRGR